MTFIPGGATAANQTTENADLSAMESTLGQIQTNTAAAATEASLGTDGATPPSIPGTGIRGWLRSIYDKLVAGIAVTGTFWQATQPVSAASLPLPSGASTEATVSAINTKLGSALPLPTGAATEVTIAAINTKLGSALPLPTGAATEATLAAVNTKLGSALPLPTGAATAAKQPALGTAGTAASDVISIQGITGGTVVTTADQAGGSTASAVPAKAELSGLRAATAYPTAVTDGQLVAAMADQAGRIVTVANAARNLIGTVQLNSSSASAVSFISAGATGVFNDIVTLVITNESATATIVTLSDNGSGGTAYKFAIAANGGIVINFPTPLPQGTSAAAWDVLNSAAVALDYVAVFVRNK